MRPNLPLRTHQSLTAALQNSTAGVALFDEQLQCAAVNSALSSMTGLAVKACVGRTVRQIFGGQSAPLERALQLVWETESSRRDVQVYVKTNGRAMADEWIADLFPLRDATRVVRWIGAAFSQSPRKSGLQQDLLDAAKGNGSSRSRAETHELDASEIVETCAPLLSRTFSLLDHSMSLRRQVCQKRVAASLLSSWSAVTAQLEQLVSRITLVPSKSDRHKTDGYAAASKASGSLGPLSSREMEVLRFIAEGKSNKEIGAALILSTRTVETYRARLMRKLGCHSIADVLRYAIRNQLIEV